MMKHYLYIGLILALLVFVKWYSDNQYDAGYNKAVATYESELRKDLNDQIAKSNNIQAENDKLVLDLLKKQSKTEIVYEEIEKKVEVYVKQNVSCNLTRGAVSLRSESADPEQLRTGFHPALSKDDSTATSTITQRAAEKQTHKWGKLYTKWRGNYQALLKVCKNHNNKAVK